MTRFWALWAVGALLAAAALADFTPHFRRFLDARFGPGSANRFARLDMGGGFSGSFGGRASDSDLIRNTPVIFVHGLTMRAGAFLPHRNYFLSQGYQLSELYATTYSDGGLTPFFSKTMNCEDVQLIRDFIKAVYLYTNSTVDVLAYSMGVAISRKAILGGRCVDTNEYLGGPLTSLVHTYVGLAGVAYGYENCPAQFKACNDINGMDCGSQYIRDVNNASAAYEGAATYAIFSSEDYLVGQRCCHHRCSELKNANGTVVEQGYDHVGIFVYTKETQLALLRNGTAPSGTQNTTENSIESDEIAEVTETEVEEES